MTTREQRLQEEFENSFLSLHDVEKEERKLCSDMGCGCDGVVRDSEEVALRTQRARKVLQQGQIPCYHPFG